MARIRKSENILSIHNNNLKRGKSSKQITGTLFRSKHNLEDMAGDSVSKTLDKKSVEQIRKIKTSIQNCRSSVPLEKKEEDIEKKRGLIYITHLPQDYNEKKVKQYFKNIGRITNVKVYGPKIYDDIGRFGYVEFEYPEVAKFAAEKMNNDYKFSHNIKAEYISYEDQPKDLFRTKYRIFENNMNKAKEEGKGLIIRRKTVNNAKSKKKVKKNINYQQHLAIQCDLIPMELCDEIINEVKQECKSLANVKSKSNTRSKVQFTLERSSAEHTLSKNKLPPSSKKSSNKSLTDIKSNRAILTKSLDSVKAFLEKSSASSQDEGTQTPKQRKIKRERPNKNNFRKFKHMKNRLTLNSTTIKRIARELIRKRGYPLINYWKSIQ